MDFPDRVLEGYDRSYFSCGHGEHLSLPNCHLDIHSSKRKKEKSFDAEEQYQNINFNKPIEIPTIICHCLNNHYDLKR